MKINLVEELAKEFPFDMAVKLRALAKRHQPPITTEYVDHLIKLVRAEMVIKGTLQAETRPNMTALNALLADGKSGLSRYAKRSKKVRRKKK